MRKAFNYRVEAVGKLFTGWGDYRHLLTTYLHHVSKPVYETVVLCAGISLLILMSFHSIFSLFLSVLGVVILIIHSTYKEQQQFFIPNFVSNYRRCL